MSNILKRWKHKLFNCPTFWRVKPAYKCPLCGRKYWCYWDGNDVQEVGIDICRKCFKEIQVVKN